jgi:hypothetical protein
LKKGGFKEGGILRKRYLKEEIFRKGGIQRKRG